MTAPNTLPRSSPTQRRWATEQRRVQIYNTTTERIPPFSCCQIVSSIKEGSKIAATDDKYFAAFAERGQPVFLVKKPDGKASENDPSRYVFTCEASVAPNSFGSATADFPLVAASVCNNGVNHTTVGPKAGEWYLGAGKCWSLLSHDPTRSVSYKTSGGKLVHSVLITPRLAQRIDESDFQSILVSGYVAAGSPWSYPLSEAYYLELQKSGLYELWFCGTIRTLEEGVASGSLLGVAVLAVDADNSQSLLLEAWTTHQFDASDGHGHELIHGKTVVDRRIMRMTVGMKLYLYNTSQVPITLGGAPDIVTNPGTYPTTYPLLLTSGLHALGTGFVWGYNLLSQTFDDTDDAEEFGEADCMTDANDTRVIDIPPPDEDDDGEIPAPPPGGPPGGGAPPGGGFPPAPDPEGGGDEEEIP